MQVSTTTVQVHLLPKKPALALDPADRERVGVYAVEVDIHDYPIQHATAAVNAFNANVTLAEPADFTMHVYDPRKNAWLLAPTGELDFPKDGEFTGLIATDLLPIGSRLVSIRDEIDHDEHDVERLSPAGSVWTVNEIDRGSISIHCHQTQAAIYVSVCQLGTDFLIDDGYSEDASFSAEQLEEKYSPTGGGEHPMFSRLMWREAVANQDTIAGYWGWLMSEIQQAEWA